MSGMRGFEATRPFAAISAVFLAFGAGAVAAQDTERRSFIDANVGKVTFVLTCHI